MYRPIPANGNPRRERERILNSIRDDLRIRAHISIPKNNNEITRAPWKLSRPHHTQQPKQEQTAENTEQLIYPRSRYKLPTPTSYKKAKTAHNNQNTHGTIRHDVKDEIPSLWQNVDTYNTFLGSNDKIYHKWPHCLRTTPQCRDPIMGDHALLT